MQTYKELIKNSIDALALRTMTFAAISCIPTCIKIHYPRANASAIFFPDTVGLLIKSRSPH